MKLLERIITIAIIIAILASTFFAIKKEDKNTIYLPNAPAIEMQTGDGR